MGARAKDAALAPHVPVPMAWYTQPSVPLPDHAQPCFANAESSTHGVMCRHGDKDFADVNMGSLKG